MLILDETYRDFLRRDGRPHDLFADPGWRDTLVHLYSFSKSFRLTGHRTGAMIASAERLAEAEKVLDTVTICPPQLGQKAALWGLRYLGDWVAGERAEILRRRDAATRRARRAARLARARLRRLLRLCRAPAPAALRRARAAARARAVAPDAARHDVRAHPRGRRRRRRRAAAPHRLRQRRRRGAARRSASGWRRSGRRRSPKAAPAARPLPGRQQPAPRPPAARGRQHERTRLHLASPSQRARAGQGRRSTACS